MSKAVAKKAEQSSALALPDDLVLPEGAGLEAADAESFAIPFLVILQKTSPKADPDADAYVDGAKPGMLLDSVADEFFDPSEEPTEIIPVYYRRAFIEWKTRKNGGGYVGEHSVEDAASMKWTRDDDTGADILENGNQIVDTRYHYIILLRGDVVKPMVITMTSTQVKKSKRLNSDLETQVTAAGLKATFQLRYSVKTVGESNEHGTWRGWELKRAGLVTEQAHLDKAVKFYKAIKSGTVKEATDSLDTPGAAVEPSNDKEGEPTF